MIENLIGLLAFQRLSLAVILPDLKEFFQRDIRFFFLFLFLLNRKMLPFYRTADHIFDGKKNWELLDAAYIFVFDAYETS